ncbi:MAG: hypothetical protein IPJ69_03695 [Deltaproteobacteria bacterium]|nr:MAG: hypothetical protein IPJ69_03695 [Deltaproteobacteria bacterium]
MNRLLILLMLVSLPLEAADHYLQRGTNTKLKVTIDMEKGSMLMLPKTPRAVTGKTRPNFQVEVYGDKLMVTPLKVGASTNLFIDLGDNTIAAIELIGVQGGGEDLINLVFGDSPKKEESKSWKSPEIPADIQFLSGPWTIQKLGGKSSSASGIDVKVDYMMVVDDRVILHFELFNRGKEPFSVSEVTLLILNLGGVSGKTVTESQVIPTSIEIKASTLSHGQTSSGIVLAPRVSIDHDQALSLRILDSNSQGPEVRFQI